MTRAQECVLFVYVRSVYVLLTTRIAYRPTGTRPRSTVASMACIWLVYRRRRKTTTWRSTSKTLVSNRTSDKLYKNIKRLLTSFVSWRLGQRALLDVGHRFGRRGQLLLDGQWPTDHLHQLECRRAEQLPLRERRGGELHGVMEPRRQGTQVERFAVQFWNVLCVRSTVMRLRGAPLNVYFPPRQWVWA